MTDVGLQDEALTKALLTLGVEGIGAEVVDGTQQERSALTLGQTWGRSRRQTALDCHGQRHAYSWPADWSRAVTDHARCVQSGHQPRLSGGDL